MNSAFDDIENVVILFCESEKMKQISKLSNSLILIANIIVAFFFFFVWFYVEKRLLNYFYMILHLLIAGALAYFILRKSKNENSEEIEKICFLEKYKHYILWSILLVFFFAQLAIGNTLRINPLFDFASVYTGAVNWVVEGNFSDFYEYFYYYPNNLGELFFLRTLFLYASKLGITDFYFVGMFVNALSCVIAIASVFYTLDKAVGYKAGYVSLFLFLLTPPMWFTAPVFYTDSLTMFCPTAIYLLYILFEEEREKEQSSKLRFFYLLGTIVIGIYGYFLKPTVLIVFVAIFIELLLKLDWKTFLLLAGTLLLLFVGSKTMFHRFFYPNYLNEEMAYELNTPYETWVYMGLNKDFGFSGDDTLYSRSFSDPVERKAKMKEAIVDRIQERGYLGTIKHEFDKLVTAYTDGTFELSYHFQFGLQKNSNLTKYLTLKGDNYGMYWMLCAFLYYQLLLFAAILPIMNIIKTYKVNDAYKKVTFIPMLSLFGLQLFLMIWETHYRYTVNYYPILLMIAVFGIFSFSKMKH